MSTITIGAGLALAGLAELVGLNLPEIAYRVAADPSVGPGPGAAIGAWGLFAVLIGLGALANWLVWVGAQPARAQ